MLRVPPTVLAKQTRKLREENSARRARVQNARADLSRHGHADSAIFHAAELLPATEQQEMDVSQWRKEEAAKLSSHAARLAALQQELVDEEASANRLAATLTELQFSAASDTRQLANVLRAHPHPPAAQTTAAGDNSRLMQSMLDAKRTLAAQLEAQAEQAEALVSRAAAQRAALANRAAAVDQRRDLLLRGASLRRWDERTRTLKPCTIGLVADGRCFQVIDDEPGTAEPTLLTPLLMPLHRIESVAPSVATSIFARGLVPTCSWLYFTVRWHRHDDPYGGLATGAGPSSVVVRSPGDAPQAAHFACDARAECTAWILGLLEASAEARRQQGGDALTPSLSLGAIVWLQMRAMLEERARSSGQRPMRVLAAAIRSAAADSQLVKQQQQNAVPSSAQWRQEQLSSSAPSAAGAPSSAAVAATDAKRPKKRNKLARRRPPQSPGPAHAPAAA